MVRFENAHLIDAEELKEIIDDEYTNPTLERLMFIETNGNEIVKGKVFPCFVEAYGTKDGPNGDPMLSFQMCIMQSAGGEFSLVRVVVTAMELGVSKRIWDKPPTKGLSQETPWIPKTEAEVQ